MSELPSKYIVVISVGKHLEASRWLGKQDIEYMSYGCPPENFSENVTKIGFCFVDENDSLLFALRWA